MLSTPQSEEEMPALEVQVDGPRGLVSFISLGAPPASPPLALGDEWGDTFWLAHGSAVHTFPRDREGAGQVDLDSPAVQIKLFADPGVLVVVCEVGVLGLQPDGHVRWSVPTDVITDVGWERDGVSVAHMDGPRLRIAVATGVVTRGHEAGP